MRMETSISLGCEKHLSVRGFMRSLPNSVMAIVPNTLADLSLFGEGEPAHFSGNGNRVIKQLLLDKKEIGLTTRPLNALYFAYLETSDPKLLEAAYLDAGELDRPVLNLVTARLPEGLRESEIFKSELEVESSSCFIATAAYETSSHPDIDTFRAFREQIILRHFLGRFLVKVYYILGPYLAKFVSFHLPLKNFIRGCLEHLAQWMRLRQIV